MIRKWKQGRKPLGFPLVKIVYAVAGLVILGWLATGIYFVQPGEIGVVRLFGKEIAQTTPGPHYAFPQPIQQVDRVNMEKIRRAEIGFRTDDRVGNIPVAQRHIQERHLEESLMLTGDDNIAEIQVLVQYRVKDASHFLFQVRNPEEALSSATEVALRGVVGRTTIDDVMTVARTRVEGDVRTFLQKLMDDYLTGIQVIEVKLLVVDPPDEVKDAFHEVVRALEDRERLVREAEGYREDLVPRARGDAERKVKAAEAYMEQRVRRAEGEAKRFENVLAEYMKAPRVTRERMYLEFAQEVLPGVDKVIMNPAAAAGAGVQQLLPLRSLVDFPAAQKP
jgi:membrane protease subunit HflK